MLGRITLRSFPRLQLITTIRKDKAKVFGILLLLGVVQLVLQGSYNCFISKSSILSSDINYSVMRRNPAECPTKSKCPFPSSASDINQKPHYLASKKCCKPYRSLKTVNNSHDPMQTYRFPARQLRFNGPHKVSCDANTELFIAVKSSFGNYARRQTVRSTWLSKHNCTPVAERNSRFCKWVWQRTKVAFFVSTPHPHSMDNVDLFAVMQEVNTYGDVVQTSFVEHYHNLTLKTVSSLYWAASNCWQAKYIVSADDDTLVNLHRLWQTILSEEGDTESLANWQNEESYPDKRSKLFSKTLFGGYLKHKDWVMRYDKWATSLSAYLPSEYPDVLVGWFVLMSRCVVERIVRASMCTRLLWIDDAFLFGILAEALGLRRHPIHGLVPVYERPRAFPYNGTCVSSLAILMGYHENAEELWSECQ